MRNDEVDGDAGNSSKADEAERIASKHLVPPTHPRGNLVVSDRTGWTQQRNDCCGLDRRCLDVS